MRSSRNDFDPLLKEPLLNWVGEQEAASRLQAGAVPMDVRLEDEFNHGTLAGAINIPLYLFRLKADSLDRSRHYIVFCDTGQRSATAAFLLEIRGIESSVIRGGIDACGHLALSAPRTHSSWPQPDIHCSCHQGRSHFRATIHCSSRIPN
ncbi:MAG: rhodanese-like domain-containing protein [Arenicellales bacterium]